MTELHKPVRRKTRTLRGQPLVVILTPEGLVLHEPKRRTKYLLPYGHAYQYAADLYAQAERRRKAAERKARQAAKAGAR